MGLPTLHRHAAQACRPAVTLLAALAAGAASAQVREPALPLYALATDVVPSSTQAAGLSRMEVVRWAPAGSGAWGMALGATRDGDQPLRPGVGLRWRSRLDQGQRLDLSAWRHFDADSNADPDGRRPALASLSTRIELQFTTPRPGAGLGEQRGALGVQLGSSSNFSMRIRRGGPMVYYRMQF